MSWDPEPVFARTVGNVLHVGGAGVNTAPLGGITHTSDTTSGPSIYTLASSVAR